MKVPLVDLTQQYNLNHQAFQRALEKVCSSGRFILGPEVERFERRFSRYLGVKGAVGLASGTDALRLACQALGIGAYDEVLIPANTFIATALAVYHLGAIPVPVDVEPDSFLMDLDNAKKRLSPKTKAIVAVHLYGQSLDMEEVLAFAKRYSLILIEDCAQAHGAKWNKRRVGSFGQAGCFSFYPSKNLGCFGDGGMVVSNDPSLLERLRMLRNYGSRKKHIYEIPGTNSRLDSLQAALLNVKLDFLEEWNAKRFRAACRYAEFLDGFGDIKLPLFERNNTSQHVFHLFVIQSQRRNELLNYLKARGIECGIHYPIPFHLQRVFATLGYRKGGCPVAEHLARRILSLPMFPEISAEQIDTVTGAIRRFYE